MKNLVKFDCYIEEYRNHTGNICARLKDKGTNKKIVITGKNADKEHLLRFFSQAKINNSLMPTIYDRNGTDIVAVRGYVISNTEDEIKICIDIESGGYLFE